MPKKAGPVRNASPVWPNQARYGDSAEMLGGLRGMVIVPSPDARRVSRAQYVVADYVQGETAVNCDFAAFVFVFRNVRRKMRHNILHVHNAITHVYVCVVKSHKVIVADAWLGQSIDNWRKIPGGILV